MLQSHGLISTRALRGSDDNDLDDGYGGLRRRRRHPDPNRFPKVPSDVGRELMDSGLYGSRDGFVDTRRRRKTSLSQRLMWRKLGVEARGTQRRANRLITQVRSIHSRIQFADQPPVNDPDFDSCR